MSPSKYGLTKAAFLKGEIRWDIPNAVSYRDLISIRNSDDVTSIFTDHCVK